MSDFTSASTEYEFVFKAMLHVLVYAYMELAAIVIERPGTELVYVTVVILQDLFHGPGVTGAGRLDANYVQTECQFRYCGTAIPFLTVRSTAR